MGAKGRWFTHLAEKHGENFEGIVTCQHPGCKRPDGLRVAFKDGLPVGKAATVMKNHKFRNHSERTYMPVTCEKCRLAQRRCTEHEGEYEDTATTASKKPTHSKKLRRRKKKRGR